MEPHNPAHCLSALKPLRAALAVINGKWKLPILVALDTGQCRFGDLKASIPAISAKVLAKELKDLEMHQLIRRTVQPGPPVAVSYQVLPYARTLDPIIFRLRDWGLQHQERLTALPAPAEATTSSH